MKTYILVKIMPLVKKRLLNENFFVRWGSFRPAPDYDDAWLFACAMNSEVVFDIGARMGDSTFIALLSPKVKRIIMVDSDPVALTFATENLLCNNLMNKVQPACAFISESCSSRVKTATIDSLCEYYGLLPDLIKIDVEGTELKVLYGNEKCASFRKSRYLVEMHSTKELTMHINAEKILEWCNLVRYKAWYLKEKTELITPEQIEKRGRCHLLIQPSEWGFPDWLKKINQSDPLEKVAGIFGLQKHFK